MLPRLLVNRYEIKRCLGKQSGRQTLLAWDRETQQQVVIKLLTFSPDFVWDDLKLFQREAATLEALDHPAIPRYWDAFDVALPQAQGFALVQSYVAGTSLADQLKKGYTFSEAEVIQLAAKLLEILVYLQARRPPVIHRDIKPSNILLTSSDQGWGKVYLVDFGSVQTLAAREGGTITVVGSYGYMPPEQFGGRAVPASDLYGLGATLIYLVTGRHPADIPQRQLKLQFEPLTRLSSALTRWLAGLVAPGLDERFASAEAALQQLNTLFFLQQNIHQTTAATSLAHSRPQNSRVILDKVDQTLTVQLITQKAQAGSQRRSLPVLLRRWPVLVTISITLLVIEPMLLTFPGMLLFASVCQLIFSGTETAQRHQTLLSLKAGRLTVYANEGSYGRSPQPQHSSSVTAIVFENHGQSAQILFKGDRPYQLHNNELVSTQDLQWLAHEMGRWLNLPVTHNQDYAPLPIALFRHGEPKPVTSSSPIPKPSGSRIVILKRATWIEVLCPVKAETEAYNRVYIDDQQIRQATPFRKDPTPSMRVAITAIEHHRGDSDSKGFLRIWAGQQKYDLGDDGSLSAAELTWLAYEFSEWLKVAIYET